MIYTQQDGRHSGIIMGRRQASQPDHHDMHMLVDFLYRLWELLRGRWEFAVTESLETNIHYSRTVCTMNRAIRLRSADDPWSFHDSAYQRMIPRVHANRPAPFSANYFHAALTKTQPSIPRISRKKRHAACPRPIKNTSRYTESAVRSQMGNQTIITPGFAVTIIIRTADDYFG
jgi:hypothetical protein